MHPLLITVHVLLTQASIYEPFKTLDNQTCLHGKNEELFIPFVSTVTGFY